MPDAERHREPSFNHYTHLSTLEPGGGRAQVFMGELGSARSGTRTFSPIVGADLHIGGHGVLRLPLEAAWENAMIDGEVVLDGRRLTPGGLHYLGTCRTGLDLSAERPAHALLIGGAPFGEAIVTWWDFVARTAEEIRAARDDEDLRRYQLRLAKTGVSLASINAALTGLKFFFEVTAERADAIAKMSPGRATRFAAPRRQCVNRCRMRPTSDPSRFRSFA